MPVRVGRRTSGPIVLAGGVPGKTECAGRDGARG